MKKYLIAFLSLFVVGLTPVMAKTTDKAEICYHGQKDDTRKLVKLTDRYFKLAACNCFPDDKHAKARKKFFEIMAKSALEAKDGLSIMTCDQLIDVCKTAGWYDDAGVKKCSDLQRGLAAFSSE